MRRRLLLNSFLFALVIALALFIYFKPQPVAAPELKLSTLMPAAAAEITLEKPGQPALTLRKKNSQWRIITPFQARADSAKVEGLLSILTASGTQRLEAAGLARFELDKPRLRLTINQQSFSFGMLNPLSHEQYIATQNAVYLISARYFAMASAPPGNLASKQLFATDEVPIGFQFGKSRLALTDGKWNVLPAQPNSSQDQLNQWADEWRHAASLAGTAYSGQASVAEFNIQLSNGKNILIKILQHEPELILLRSDENREYYFSAETAKRLLIF